MLYVAMCLLFLDLLGVLDKIAPILLGWHNWFGKYSRMCGIGASMRDVISVERALWSQF